MSKTVDIVICNTIKRNCNTFLLNFLSSLKNWENTKFNVGKSKNEKFK